MQHSNMFSIQRGSRRKSRGCQHMVIYGSATTNGSRRNKSKTSKGRREQCDLRPCSPTKIYRPCHVLQYYYYVKFQCLFEILESYAPLVSSKGHKLHALWEGTHLERIASAWLIKALNSLQSNPTCYPRIPQLR